MSPIASRRPSDDIWLWLWQRTSGRVDLPSLLAHGSSDENTSEQQTSKRTSLRLNIPGKRQEDADEDDDDRENETAGGKAGITTLEETQYDEEGDEIDEDERKESPVPPPSISTIAPPSNPSLVFPPKPTLPPLAQAPILPTEAASAPPLQNTVRLPDPTSSSTSQEFSTTLTPLDPRLRPTVTATVISIMTTTPPSQTTATNQQKKVDDSATGQTVVTTASPSSTFDFAAQPTPPAEGGRDQDRDRDGNDGLRGQNDGGGDKNRGLDATAEHLLISVGAIGAFILFCFVGWIVYRTMKRTRGWGGSNGGLRSRLPWNREKDTMPGDWKSRASYPPSEPPPVYDKSDLDAAAGFYGSGKQYGSRPGSVARSVTVPGTLPPIRSSNSPLANVIDEYDLANGATIRSNDLNQTMRSRRSDPFFNQSELARQPSAAYDPGQRRVYRASELSSISSGFGDGDIIAPPPPPEVNKPTAVRTPNNVGGRFSWMSRGGDSRRETMYTTTSEDRPARFRSVNSWVNQQTGRVKRAETRALERGEIPVMPAIPGQVAATHQTAYQ